MYSIINKCVWVNERQIALQKALNRRGNDRIHTHEFSRTWEGSTLWWFLSQTESWRLHYHLPGLSCDCWQAHWVYKCQRTGLLRGSVWGFADWKVTDLRAKGPKGGEHGLAINTPCCNLWHWLSLRQIKPQVLVWLNKHASVLIDALGSGHSLGCTSTFFWSDCGLRAEPREGLWSNMLLSLRRQDIY